ncbi:MAG TPA: nuclear transport factor 2 family protein [Candidatus Limnocylindrales bacterium]|nr:nuclear transport factor 2 family protein [Candidatus Limnocylindrales bacterium]
MNFSVAAVLLLTTTGFFAQKTATPSGAPGEIKNALLRIEQEIGQANLNCDYRYFERIEAEEFIFTDSQGRTSNKPEDLAGEKDCHRSDATYDLDDTDVRLYPAAAVVTGRVTITRKKEGTSIVRRSRFTDVFVWRDNQWQLVAGHSSRIPDAAVPK